MKIYYNAIFKSIKYKIREKNTCVKVLFRIS